ncbi:MAG: ArsA family ATPase [Thermosynechococcaceae cyanobacterium]
MSFILTFLGKGGTGRTTVAIAAAKQLASQGKRVLLTTQDPGPVLELFLGAPVGPEPQNIEPNLQALQFQTAALLEKSWDQVKELEAQYVRTPFFKNVYGQELGVLPGLESALSLNAIREYDASGNYDVIIVDGPGDQNTLRMLGMPEVLSWYIRRFRQVFADSDLGRVLSPFIQPISSAVLTVNWSGDNFAQPTEQVNNQLDEGKNAVANPKRVAAYLVTTGDDVAIATARYLWGSAQQVGLTVGGVLMNQPVLTMPSVHIDEQFVPLAVSAIPHRNGEHWQPLMSALPNFTEAEQAPQPIVIDLAQQQVKLFLPGFDKKQVKLTQYGPEVTIEAGDQRRNIFLPPELRGKPVQGAKFQGSSLIISF